MTAPGSTRPPLRRRLLLVAALALALIMFFRWFEHSQVYHPSRHLHIEAAQIDPNAVDLNFPSLDGTPLHGWFLPAPSLGDRPTAQRRAVLVCHGNGGNISHRLDLAELLRGLELDVVLFDYRGYGRSQGRPSEAGTYQDARAAWNLLLARGYPATNLLVLGESLGGAISAHLARDVHPAGLILQSTFTSVPDLGVELFPWLPVRRLSRIHYPTREYLGQLRCPVLLLHSRQDTLVTFHHAEENLAAAREPKYLRTLSGDHNDALAVDPLGYRAALGEFLNTLKIPAPPK